MASSVPEYPIRMKEDSVVTSQKNISHTRLLANTSPNIAARKTNMTKKNIPRRSLTSG